MAKKKNWIKKAVPKSHEGKFTAKAKAAGKTVSEFAKEKEDAPGTLGKEVRLAETFQGMARKRRIAYKKKD